LLSYASPWTNDSNANAPSRKRIPSIGKDVPANNRKTVKVRPAFNSDQYQFYQEDAESAKPGPESINELKDKQTQQNTHINGILNRITSFSNDDRLGDFNPMPYPPAIKMDNSEKIIPAERAIEVEENPLMPATRINSPEKNSGVYYKPAEPSTSSHNYANYKQAYGKEGLVGREPYYSKMGISGSKGASGDKLMDRINYMTQMLESLQMEKTNHVAEEFVLYTLLGVFMIYIVDGFSRGGKYIR